MGNRARTSLLALLTVIATAASAQSNLGELLDKGFRKVTKSEFGVAVFGARVSTVNVVTGNTNVSDYKGDGTFSGAWYGPAGGGQGVYSGTWTMDETGKLCWTSKHLWGVSDGCTYWFHNGEQFYGSRSEIDRDAPVYRVTVKK